MKSENLLTVAKAAELWAVKPVTVRAWAGQRRIASVKLGRSLRIPEGEIQRLIDEGYQPARANRW
jgi:excisionase family DNA binding protein